MAGRGVALSSARGLPPALRHEGEQGPGAESAWSAVLSEVGGVPSGRALVIMADSLLGDGH